MVPPPAVTVTATDALPLPPAPVHSRPNVPLLLRAGDCSEPLVALLPAHEPEAAHVVAFVDDQVSIVAEPGATDVGFADNVTTGAASRETVTERLREPPAPVQARV